jgi:hypothetical protein
MAMTSSSLLLLALAGPLLAAPPDPMFRAMADELARSTTLLRLEPNAPPYFVAYRQRDSINSHIQARFGSLVRQDLSEPRSRFATIELRVGSPQLDQTHFQSPTSFLTQSWPVAMPLEDDYLVARHALWQGTDAIYKNALETLAKKKAVLESRKLQDATPDFVPAPATQSWVDSAPLVLDRPRGEALARELSGLFRGYPAILRSNVELDGADQITRFLNSEGSRTFNHETLVTLAISAHTQAADGSALGQFHEHYARTQDGLPSQTQLRAETRKLAEDLTALRQAPAFTENYSGPVLFEGTAAVKIFSRIMTGKLVATRKSITEGAAGGGVENSFQHRLGARVLLDSLSVTDEPGRTEFQGIPLLGGAKVDEEGIPTRTVRLIDHGKLRALLTSREPVPGFAESTGSCHGGAAAPSNVIVQADPGLPAAELRTRLMQAAQERGLAYAMVVRDLTVNGDHLEPIVVKLFPDGHEQAVRNAEMTGLTFASFRDLLAAGQEPQVGHYYYRHAGPGQSATLMSLAVPALLFQEVGFQKPGGTIPTPPHVQHPYFDSLAK